MLLALLSLCEKSVRLPKVEPEAEDIPVKKDWSFAPFGTEHCYWEIFDPETREEPVACSLWDDGEDIGNELMEGCRLFEAGRPQEALWHWKFSFETHWGHHAFGALRALYAICFWKDGGCFWNGGQARRAGAAFPLSNRKKRAPRALFPLKV